MSEPVYHILTIFNKVDSTPTVAWLTAGLNPECKDSDCWDFSVEQSILDKGIFRFHFTTLWEPKLALILEASREFPETQFQLDFTGSVGTVIEDPVHFVIKDGAILTFEGFPCGDLTPEKMFFDVLEYCGHYAGGSSPFVQQVAASLLDQGMRVENANGREITRDSRLRTSPLAHSGQE